MFLQSVSAAAMEKSMSALWQRQQLIQTNMANEDTPGYKAKRLSFESALQSEMNRAQRSKGMNRSQKISLIDSVKPEVYEQEGTIVRADGNNVDLLAEQNELTRVQYQYQALTQRVTSYYSNLRYAINGGR